MTKSSSEITYIPYEKAYEKGFEDMRHRKPDITKIEKLINFKPRVGIDKILENIIKYFEK